MTYDLIGYTTATLSTASSYYKITTVVGVELCCKYWVAEGFFRIGYG